VSILLPSMLASPGETADTARETVDFCRKVGLGPEVFFSRTAGLVRDQ
jgi:hypothetical protein